MVNLGALVSLPCNNQSKDLSLVMYLHHLDNMMCVSIYMGILMHPLPGVTQLMCIHHFCQKLVLTSPGFKQYSWLKLSNPLEYEYMHATN